MSGLMESYKNLITSQHRGKPNYMATVEALLKYSEGMFECSVYMDDYFDLDLAGGAQEDVLGVIVGASRQLPFQPQTQETSLLNNDDYRVLIRAKIAKNLWRGGIEDLETIWQTLFGERIKIIDNQDMTIEVIIDQQPSNVVREMISRGMIVPKPQSVNANYNFVRTLDGGFFIGGYLNQHIKTVVSPALPDGGDISTDVYIGGKPSTHLSALVRNALPSGGDIQSDAYIGGTMSIHRASRINSKMPVGGRIVVRQYIAGDTSKHHKVVL